MIRSSLVPVARLSQAQRDEMLRLFARYYDRVQPERFFCDLDDKDDVFCFHDGGTLIGFSTVLCRRLPECDGAICLFSGDTVIDRPYWGGRFLQAQFLRYIVQAKLAAGPRPLYWMLLSKGHKTYLLMRRNFPRSYPQYAAATEPKLGRLRDAFYTQRYGSAYDKRRGIVAHAGTCDAVKAPFVEPDAAALTDPEVAFFVRANPSFREGDELACIAQLCARDFARHIVKYVLRPPRRTPRPQDARCISP